MIVALKSNESTKRLYRDGDLIQTIKSRNFKKSINRKLLIEDLSQWRDRVHILEIISRISQFGIISWFLFKP